MGLCRTVADDSGINVLSVFGFSLLFPVLDLCEGQGGSRTLDCRYFVLDSGVGHHNTSRTFQIAKVKIYQSQAAAVSAKQ